MKRRSRFLFLIPLIGVFFFLSEKAPKTRELQFKLPESGVVDFELDVYDGESPTVASRSVRKDFHTDPLATKELRIPLDLPNGEHTFEWATHLADGGLAFNKQTLRLERGDVTLRMGR